MFSSQNSAPEDNLLYNTTVSTPILNLNFCLDSWNCESSHWMLNCTDTDGFYSAFSFSAYIYIGYRRVQTHKK